MRLFFVRVCVGVCLCASLLSAGPRVSAGGGIYERLICVVPIVGTGTVDDPKRPMFVPLPGHAAADARPSKGFSDPPAIVGFHSVLSDDGQSAIVEFIARDRAAFKPILAQPANLLFSADPHLQPSATLLQQLRKFNKNFNLASFLRGGL